MRRATWMLALPLALAAAWPAVAAPPSAATPDPVDNPVLRSGGFLDHHQDIKYRLLGMQAYRRQRYEDAVRFYRRASFFADKPSQGMLAEMYWTGTGVAQDRALGYAWMDLAAERGYTGFLGLRERYWKALDAAERARAVAEGQAIYARFGDDAAKPRYAAALRRGRNAMAGSRTGFDRGVQIEVPGPAGPETISASRFFDARYWDPQKYWAWQDSVWARPRIGKVTVGDLEVAQDAPGTRIPQVAPEADAPLPTVPDANTP